MTFEHWLEKFVVLVRNFSSGLPKLFSTIPKEHFQGWGFSGKQCDFFVFFPHWPKKINLLLKFFRRGCQNYFLQNQSSFLGIWFLLETLIVLPYHFRSLNVKNLASCQKFITRVAKTALHTSHVKISWVWFLLGAKFNFLSFSDFQRKFFGHLS